MSVRLQRSATGVLELGARPEVDDRAHAELAEPFDAGRLEVVERIAAVQHAGARGRTVARRQSAEVAEVVGARELDEPRVVFDHDRVLLRDVPG